MPIQKNCTTYILIIQLSETHVMNFFKTSLHAGVTLYNETYLSRAVELWKHVLDPTRNPTPESDDQIILTEAIDFLKRFTHDFSNMAIVDR